LRDVDGNHYIWSCLSGDVKMSVAKFRKVYSHATPSGRFVVSEGRTCCGPWSPGDGLTEADVAAMEYVEDDVQD
jgi:hypothetical protein